MQKIRNIQALRGFAVLAVILFHLIIIERKYGGGNILLPGFLEFGMFGVDLFFVISGFVMVTVTRGRFQVVRDALLFLYHRASRIYPLYWVYSLAALGVFLIKPTWVNSSQGSQVDILASFLLLPAKVLPLVQVGWTLIHEMYFYLIFFLILLAVPERFLLHALAVWGALLLGLRAWIEPGNPYWDLILNPLTFEFLSGCVLAVFFYKTKPLPLRGGWLTGMAALAVGAAIFGYLRYHAATGGVSPDGWWRVLIYGVPAILIVFCMTHAEQNGFVFSELFVQTGNASYSLYLSHLFTLNVVGRIWGFVASPAIFDNVLGIVIAFAASIVVGFLSYWWIETPLLKLSRRVA